MNLSTAEHNLQISANHEAGHAVVAAYFGYDVAVSARASENKTGGGMTWWSWPFKTRLRKKRNEWAITAAGYVGEILAEDFDIDDDELMIWVQDKLENTHDDEDREDDWSHMPKARALQMKAIREASQIIRKQRRMFDAVIRGLLEREDHHLSGNWMFHLAWEFGDFPETDTRKRVRGRPLEISMSPSEREEFFPETV